MRKFIRVLLHLLSFPALIGVILWADLDIIKSQYKNYSYYTLIGLLVPVVMMIIFYLVYVIVTRKNAKSSKLCQTVVVCLLPIFTLGGLWVACDRYLPDVISDATSSTIFYEDLAEESWKERADVNEDLLNQFIKLSVMAGTLPTPVGSTEEEAIKYYQSQSVTANLPELEDCKYYHTINELIAIQYQSINANGYASFTQPWIDFATGGRMTIPCLLHLLLDKRTVDPDDIDNLDSPTVQYHEDEDGNIVIDEVLLAVYDIDNDEIVLKPLAWTVIDMLGENQEFSLGPTLKETKVIGDLKVEDVYKYVATTVDSTLRDLSIVVADDDILGAEIYISFDLENGNLALIPANTEVGIEKSREVDGLYGKAALDYMKMAWLNSNGLLYAIVMLLSIRTYFIYFAAWIAVMMLLDGCARGMLADEKERKEKLYTEGTNRPKARKYNRKDVPVGAKFMDDKPSKKMNDMEAALVRALKESGATEKTGEELLL